MPETYEKTGANTFDAVETETRRKPLTIKQLRAMRQQAVAYRQQFVNEIAVIDARIAWAQANAVAEDP